MIQQLNSVDQYCCLFHIVHQGTTVLLSKEATACTVCTSAAPPPVRAPARAGTQAPASDSGSASGTAGSTSCGVDPSATAVALDL
jgi:hypothetical protein